MFFTVVVAIFVSSLPLSCGTGCTTSTFQFGSTPFSGYTSVDADNPVSYLMDAPDYLVPDDCTCGVLYKWHFYAVNAGVLHLQVWSRVSESLFTLKGENYYNVPSALAGQNIEFDVPIRDRITVRNNYLIGWYSSSSGVIGFETSSVNNMDILRKATAVSDLNPGDSFGWQATGVTQLEDTHFAFGASVMANTAPAFTNLPWTTSMYTAQSAGSYLYTVSVDDIDSNDVSSLLVYIDDDSTSYFNYSRADQKLYLARTNIEVGTYTVTFTVSDQCGNTGTGTFTVTVRNWTPTLANLPNFTTFSEDVTNEIELYRITFTDSDNDTLAESVALTSTPSTTNFERKYYGQNFANRSIITKQGASYNYGTAQYYKLTMTLTDGTTPTQNGYFLVYVTKNDPPKITNLPSGAQANVSYLYQRNDSFVYAVSVSDAENDLITWTLTTCLPSPCPFYIERGIIYNTKDLIRTYEPGYDLSITVADSDTNRASTKTLTVLMQDINDKPVISNLPLTNPIVVYENTALGTSIFTVLYRDFDTADVHTTQATYDETWPRNYFNLNITTGVLYTAHNIIDFEVLAAVTADWDFVMNITVSDGFDWDTASLTVRIGNINEAPSFHQNRYTLEPPETASVGGSAGAHNMELNDVDLLVVATGEVHTYKWDCGNNTRFFLMSSAGAVTYSEDFNLDTSDAIFPYDCVVTVTDREGLSATTTLQIEVQDTNNNAPVFPQTSTYLIIQDPFLTPGRFVGQVTANDIDKSEKYGRIYYSFFQVPVEFSESYMYINDLGNIYVNESWPTSLFDYGVTYELIVHAANAVDETGVRLTATATVSLVLPGTTTVYTTTTDRPKQFIEDNRNVAWVMGESALGAGLIILAFAFALAYTIQTKRYRWCLPYCRKKFLGLKKMTRREKRTYYRDILIEQMESSGEDESSSSTDLSDFSDDLPIDPTAPPVWDKMRQWVPKAAAYDEPRPPLKRDISGLSAADTDGPPAMW